MILLDLKSSWLWYMFAIFRDNFIVKFFWSILAIFISQIYTPNETLLKLIILLFLIDFATGVAKALKNRVFRISIFARGTMKLMFYGVFMLLALAVDESIGFAFFLPMMFVYFTTTDAGSILENVEELWYPVPRPLVQLFKVHKQKFFYDKIKEFTWQDMLLDYHKDFVSMKDTYIPLIKDKTYRRMFELKIQILEWFVNRISEVSCADYWKFKIQFTLLLETVWAELEEKLKREQFKTEDINVFLSRHFNRVDQFLPEVNKILKTDPQDNESSKQKKNNIIQSIIRIIYNWIADNIQDSTRYKLKIK